MMFRRIVPLALLAAACTVSPAPRTTTTATTPDPTTTSTEAPDVSPTTAIPACLSGTQQFVESGSAGVVDRDDTDSRILSAVRWSTADGCERVVIEFATVEGAPAVIPPSVGGLFMRSAGVVRLNLDDALTGSAVRDQVVDTAIASHIYVVRRPGGELFADLHLDVPATVRVATAASPARLVIDLVVGGAPYPNPPLVGDDIVVMDPVGGTATYPFTVNGYWLTDETEIVVAAANADGALEARDAVGAGPDAWGAFTVLLQGPSPAGPSTITVGPDVAWEIDLVG